MRSAPTRPWKHLRSLLRPPRPANVRNCRDVRARADDRTVGDKRLSSGMRRPRRSRGGEAARLHAFGRCEKAVDLSGRQRLVGFGSGEDGHGENAAKGEGGELGASQCISDHEAPSGSGVSVAKRNREGPGTRRPERCGAHPALLALRAVSRFGWTGMAWSTPVILRTFATMPVGPTRLIDLWVAAIL